MKRTLTLMLCLMAAAVAEAFDFSATAPTGQRLYYELIGTTTVKVVAPEGSSWGNYDQPEGHLLVPATVTYEGTTYSVTTIGLRAFANDILLTSVTLQEGIERIDMMAFFGCKSLSTIGLPESLNRIAFTSFDGTAYYNDESNWNSHHTLTLGHWVIVQANLYNDTVRVVEGIVGLANSAFLGCTQVPKVVLPSTMKYLGDGTFRDCSSLDTVQLYCAVPPQLATSTFEGLGSLVAEVPCGTLGAYDTVALWQALTLAERLCDTTTPLPADTVVPINPWPGGPVIGTPEVDECHPTVTITAEGALVLGARGQALTLYDAQGRRIHHVPAAGNAERLPLPSSGLYILVPGEGLPVKISYCK